MKQKYLVEICRKGREDDSWVETMWCEDEQGPHNIIRQFNLTLRPGEKARKVLAVTHKTQGKKRPHEWEKSNLVTISKGGSTFDTYRCKNCAVTGKRFTLGGGIERDKKYKADKYKFCSVV
jgi:hypothetical protein